MTQSWVWSQSHHSPPLPPLFTSSPLPTCTPTSPPGLRKKSNKVRTLTSSEGVVERKPAGQYGLHTTWSPFVSPAANLRTVGSDSISHVVSHLSIPESRESRIRSAQGKKLVWRKGSFGLRPRAGFLIVEWPHSHLHPTLLTFYLTI